MTAYGRKLHDALRRRFLRLRLHSRDFTIVSNNCWGAHIYQQLGKPYQTPFIGLFLAPSCYLSLVNKFRWYMQQPLRFKAKSRHDYINEYREAEGLEYPIGALGNIEIQFLHYGSEREASQKWLRRAERVCDKDSNLFFKFCDRDGCTEEQLAAFEQAPPKNKVCFVSKPMPSLGSAVWIPSGESDQVADGLRLSQISPAYFDAAAWIRGGNGKPHWWVPLRCA